MSISYPEKERYSIEDLVQILALLRSPEGCPWDRVQTHESIRSNMLEEAHEALEAINQQDTEHLKEELGDVLFQVVFHAQMEAESGHFTFDDVADGICKKMLVRHPHVFGNMTASDAGQALRTWDAVKRQTNGNKSQTDLLSNVPRSLPALMRAEKVQNRAARVGYDYADLSEALEALSAAQTAVQQAAASGESDAAAVGKLLFAVSAVARLMKWDAEQALTDQTDAFVRTFSEWEKNNP
ncbi:MAG: nucleoside triphosphate pyrophosphohydrolase [Clostridia bacterium]|nr:nucleoside triphosphate pyrophosphohydrolase [Clostridia bacterium]